MNRRKLLIGVLIAVLLTSAVALSLANGRDSGVEVELATVEKRDLVATVTASGNIRARRTVDIRPDISARVASLEVDEGDDVEAGQVLLRLDPAQLEAAVARAEASLSQAQAQEANQRANHARARRELERMRALGASSTSVVSQQEVEDAETNFEVATANLAAAEYGIQQARASLDEARDRLSKTVIEAPMAGRITRLSIEEGEVALIGIMNNPGSLLLTISDLSVVELVVQVDETDVPDLSLGDSASVEIDAFPDQAFAGRVTEIGNSATRPPSSAGSGQQVAIDFEVVITLRDSGADLRPDLSATAEIVTDVRTQVPAVPILALTVREAGSSETDSVADREEDGASEVEGVFRVEAGTVEFVPVVLGITGEEHFEILSGLDVGDTVVAGPYQVVRRLEDGDAVRASDSAREGP